MIKSKKIHHLLLFVTTVLIAVSCKKDPIQYNFEGKVTQSISGEAVSDVSVWISQKEVKSGVTTEGYNWVGSDVTDASGNYSIAFDRVKVTEFLIELEKDNYFPISLVESSADISTENTNTIDQRIEPKSWIRFEVTNAAPVDSDVLKLIKHNFRTGCEECIQESITEFPGAVDTTFTYATTAGEYVRFTYIDSNSGFSQLDSVFATPFETVTYTLTY